MSNKTKYVPLNEIRIDGGTQSRVKIDEKTVNEYAEEMHGGKDLDLGVVFFDGSNNWLADGFHRYHAASKAKKRSLRCEIFNGTRRDAILYSVGANARHGLRRSNEDKRKAVETLLGDPEWSAWSDHVIAEKCAVSHPFVGSIRKEVTSNDYQSNDDFERENGKSDAKNNARIGADGRTINTTNIGQQSVPESSIQTNPFDEPLSEEDRLAAGLPSSELEGYFPDDAENTEDMDNSVDNGQKPPVETKTEVVNAHLPTSQAPTAPELTTEQKIEALPLYQALMEHGHIGRIFFDQAELWFECEKIFRAAHAKLPRVRYTTGVVTDAIQLFGSIPEPSQWEGCAACKGTTRVGERADPCPRCKGGFTTRSGTGVSADAVSTAASATATSDTISA